MLKPLFPRYCLCCERRFIPAAAMDLCNECLAALPWNERCCEVCALPLPANAENPCYSCRRRPPPFDLAFAPLLYAAEPARWVQQLKFARGFREGQALACLLADELSAQPSFAADFFVPVPLSARRLIRRGHNQAIYIAQRLSKELKVPLRRTLLRRVRHTQAQADLSLTAKKRNVRGAFACTKSIPGVTAALVDDVMTSSETLRAASQALLNSGAKRIILCVATRTPSSGTVHSLA